MIPLVLSVLALLSSVTGLCYSPMLHGFAPDVILPGVLSSHIHCPPPHVFDHFHCMCVDPRVVKVNRRPGEASVDLGMLNKQRITRLASPLVGLPDTHTPGSTSSSSSWPSQMPSSGRSGSGVTGAGRIVPVLNPYGGPFNLPPVKARLGKDPSSGPNAKQRELLDKVRWQEQLTREAVELAAAAELASAARAAASVSAAAAASSVPVATMVKVSTLDLFMRDTLRKILYGY